MTSIYPREEKPNAPPSYEQATYYPQAPPVSTFHGIDATSGNILEPQILSVGMYPQPGMMYAPAMGMYPTSGMIPPSNGPPVATQMFITTQSLIYGDAPIQCTCPHCHRPIITRIEKTTGLVSWLICGAILLFGCWLGCCLIPFCIDGLKDTEHYCPNCAVLLGTRRRM